MSAQLTEPNNKRYCHDATGSTRAFENPSPLLDYPARPDPNKKTMLSLQDCRKYLPSGLTDEEVEQVRDALFGLADAVLNELYGLNDDGEALPVGS